jgi:hypothetical protein
MTNWPGILVALALAPLLGHAEDGHPPQLPPAARRVLEHYKVVVAEAKLSCDDEIRKAAEVARKELARALDQETRAGRLETALAIRARLEALPAAPDAAGTPVDLLALIDPQRDAVKGVWVFREKNLVAQPCDWGRLEIPYAPPDEYDLTAMAERIKGSDGLFFGLVHGNVRWTVSLDTQPTNGCLTGISCVDGLIVGAKGNPTTKVGRVVNNGNPSTIEFKIRRTGMTASVNGSEVLVWNEYGRLTLRPDWKTPNANALMVGVWGSEVQYSRITLVPVSGPGTKLR